MLHFHSPNCEPTNQLWTLEPTFERGCQRQDGLPAFVGTEELLVGGKNPLLNISTRCIILLSSRRILTFGICATSPRTFLPRDPDKMWAIDTQQQHLSADVVDLNSIVVFETVIDAKTEGRENETQNDIKKEHHKP